MMATRKKIGTPPKNPNRLELIAEPGKTEEASLARYAINPTLSNVVTVREYAKRTWPDELHITELAAALNEQAKAAKEGDLSQGEAMLMVQAHTLDAIFNNLAQRAARAQYMPQLEQYMRLALKAQSQCRATLESLANIKNPPIVYAKQANVTTGPQQVNNGIPAPRAREIETEQIQVLEPRDGKWLDTGTAGATGGTDQELAPVGKIDGTEDA